MIKANRVVRLLNKLQKNDGDDALFTCRKCNEAGISFQLTIMARGFFVVCFKAWDLLFHFSDGIKPPECSGAIRLWAVDAD